MNHHSADGVRVFYYYLYTKLVTTQQEIDNMDILKTSQACNTFLRVSLGVNIVVLIAVCTVLIAFSTSEPVLYSWGPPTAGRGILLSIYFSILFVSIGLLLAHSKTSNSSEKAVVEHMIAALLSTQILYKITTPATAGPANPVAISNLCISALHCWTLYLLWQKHIAAVRIENGDDTAAKAITKETVTSNNDDTKIEKS